MFKVGFIGLGIMGKPMSKNLIKAGYKLIVLDLRQDSMDELVSLGAEKAATPREVAKNCEFIITMLPNSPEVKNVVLGEKGLIEGFKAGSFFVDMSSISPIVSRELSEKLEENGVEMLDAPVSGGEPKAKTGEG
jgi:2-hydroxy-3-oxopropionate reductase